MDFIRKNVQWIALGGLAIAVFCYYKFSQAIEQKSDGSYGFKTAGFAGKVRTNNPLT